ncbi:MAG: hypothetical protein M1828_007385 [Chrysothrix sp. TS-e1954]|nr:MAG: hypothetical protein M1828_007385 [Chrysothrix sp. TS-e1954]
MSATGPFSSLNPTRKTYQHSPHIHHHWTSRNNRKGRHALGLTSSAIASSTLDTPTPTTSVREVLKGLTRMITYYPYWDISYLVAVIFTFGSVVWVINSIFAFLPYVQPSTAFANETLYGGGMTALIGATIFEVGSVLLMLEAINEKSSACFGWAIKKAFEDSEDVSGGGIEKGQQLHVRPDWDACGHHHKNKRNLVGSAGKVNAKTATLDSPSSSSSLGNDASTTKDMTPADQAHQRTQDSGAAGQNSWQWYPSVKAPRTHYLHELGFLACSSQMLGATIFWIAGFTALPGINNKLSQGLADGVYWTPQVVGGCGFIISGTLFMVETQAKWWKPAFGVLGWHIGAWNLVGGIGFTLSAIFGYWYQAGQSWGGYEAGLSTFWGSWAFLVGSAIQWYESLDKHPVEKHE